MRAMLVYNLLHWICLVIKITTVVTLTKLIPIYTLDPFKHFNYNN